jgi:RNA polymerase sigma factor (sigma-70 family)
MNIDDLDDLIERLNHGDLSAAERAFLAFEPYLRMAVRRRLSGPLRAKLDSTDVVQSVWADVLSLCREAGTRFTDRGHFRAFLLKATRNRLIERHRQHQRAIEKEQSLAELPAQESPKAREPRPSEIAERNELWHQMLDHCPPAHREILFLKREGLRLSEIAQRTGMHPGSIRRILYDLARRMKAPPRARSFPSFANQPQD